MSDETGVSKTLRSGQRAVGGWLLGMLIGLAWGGDLDAVRAGEEAGEPDQKQRSPLPDPELDLPDRVPADLRVTIGPSVALRSMQFEGDGRTITHRPEPYRGASLSVGVQLVEFDSPSLSLAFEGDLLYGVARNRQLNPLGGPDPRTELATGGGRIRLYRAVTSNLGIGLGLGAQATSFTIEPNRTYTGHRYLSADTSLRVRWHLPGDLFSIGLEGALYPVFTTNNSSGAHGDSTAFGMRTEGELAWAPFASARQRARRGWRLVGRYRYQRFRAQFPVSPIGIRGGISTDQQHVFTLSVGYVVR